MLFNKQIIEELKHQSGLLMEQAKDFNLLADKIWGATGRRIGVTTLKRLFGAINDCRKTNQFTLNTIAMYLGHASWEDYIHEKCIDSIWNYPTINTIYTDDLTVGSLVTIKYLDRIVVFVVSQLDGRKILEVRSVVNSSLQQGDVLYVHKLRKGETLEAEKVIRGTWIGNYKTHGEIRDIVVVDAENR